jgi:hypothetical protein
LGSHFPKRIPRKSREGDTKEIIPMHRELKRGLERALLKRLEEKGSPA